MNVLTAEMSISGQIESGDLMNKPKVEIINPDGKKWGPPVFDEYRMLKADPELGLKPFIMDQISDPSRPITASDYDLKAELGKSQFDTQFQVISLMTKLQLFKNAQHWMLDKVNFKAHPENTLIFASVAVAMLGAIGQSPLPPEVNSRAASVVAGLGVGWGWGKDYTNPERLKHAAYGALAMSGLAEAATHGLTSILPEANKDAIVAGLNVVDDFVVPGSVMVGAQIAEKANLPQKVKSVRNRLKSPNSQS